MSFEPHLPPRESSKLPSQGGVWGWGVEGARMGPRGSGSGAAVPTQPASFHMGLPLGALPHPRNVLLSPVIAGSSPSCPTPRLQVFAGRQESAVRAGGLGWLEHTQIKWKQKQALQRPTVQTGRLWDGTCRSSWAQTSPGWALRFLTRPPCREALPDGVCLYTNQPVMGGAPCH